MIVTLTGPSCAGKSTLEKLLVKRGFSNAISTTTRQPRAGDVDGESYYFVDREAFEDGLKSDVFVEHVEFGGNYYGLSAAEVRRLEKLGKPIVVVCEPVGQKQIVAWCKKNHYPVLGVWVDNPLKVVTERFMRRFATELDYGYDEKLIATYGKRLHEMMTTEREWAKEAWKGISSIQSPYNLRIAEFNEQTQDEVVDVIAGIALREPEPA